MPNLIVREPVYQQLNQVLRNLIGSEFAVGSRFLTERQVAERFGVSRVTANKALSSLVGEGLLEFRKGVGTFVRGRPMDYNLRALVSFTDEAIAAGKRPATRVLLFRSLVAADAPEEISGLLGTGPEDGLFYMERLRVADEIAVILERRYVVGAHCPYLSEADAAGSIYAVWTGRYNLEIEGADQSIRAVNITGPDARILSVREGAAGLLVTSVGYLDEHRPLWFERTLYRGDAYEFHNRLVGIQAGQMAGGRFLDSARKVD